ncbi:2-hydroxyacyl-CoA dehydratase subunit D [Haloimpatiens massiliensis]|uniref:2-hydroxyacyl-CoA dehydratase subunit D n=1 Tax=Haloimpatiens massiliensis TaxID=1658110 RepID=UPI000C81E9A5|nr:2-hydroxyacyl-CoA dehydratase family protein [Haloimpatiens massiliensis]
MNEKALERFKRNVVRISSGTLNQLDNANDLQEMTYFTNILKNTFTDFSENPNTYIGSYCVMVPDELIYAFGYTPMRLCSGHNVAAMLGDELVPRDACPVIKASVGFQFMNILPIYKQCKAVILPLTCDGKKKSADILAKKLPVIPLPISTNKSVKGFDDDYKNLIALTKSLSSLTGRKLSNKKLIKAYKMIREAQDEVYLLTQLLAADHPLLKGSQFFAIVNSYNYANIEEWTMQLKKLNQILIRKKESIPIAKRKKVRVFLAGSPIMFPNFKIPFLLEKLGAHIVGDETCMSGRMLYDPVVPDNYSTDGILRALAARYISACTCPVFEQMDDAMLKLGERVKQTKAEGIIYHVLRGCTPYDFELSKVEKLAQKYNIPVLRIETDFSIEDLEQVKIRLEAFIEMLEQRR